MILVRLLVMVILARWITPAEFGTAELVLLIIGFSNMVAGMGITPAIVQRKDLEDRHVTAGLATVGFFSLSFAVFFFALSPTIAAFAEKPSLTPLLQLAVLLFPLNACVAVPKALLQRSLQFKRLAIIEIIAFTLGYGLVGAGMALMGFGAVTLLAASLARATLYATLVWRVAPKFRFEIPTRQAFADLMKMGPGFGIAQIGNYLAKNADRAIVFRAFGDAAMGIYGRAFMLGEYPEQVLGRTLDQVLFPVMSSCQDSQERLRRVYRRGCVLLASFSFPCIIPLIIASDEVVLLVLGPQWSQAGPIFRVIAFVLAIRFLNKLNECLTRAVGAVYRRAWRVWSHAAMIVIFAWVGSQFDLNKVVVCVGLATVIYSFLMMHLSLKLLGVSWAAHLASLKRPTLVFAFTLTVAWLVAALIRQHEGANLSVIAICLFVPLLVHTTILIKWPRLLFGAESEWMLNAIWNTLPSQFRSIRFIQLLLHNQQSVTP